MNQIALSNIVKKFRSIRSGTLHLICLTLLVVSSIGGCNLIDLGGQTNEVRNILINVERDGEVQSGTSPYGSTVRQALQSIQAVYNPDDVIQPPLGTVLTNDTLIRIKVVTQEEETSERIIPFLSQTVRNESLPEGETYIIQSGQNGLERVTTRSVFEDGLLVSQLPSNREVIRESVPEILMVGVQAEHAPIQIPGKLIYLSNGNAWLMESSTGNRVPIVTTGDLDGRVLDLSSNGEWLMYSRKGQNEECNSLWMLHITDWSAQPISLRVSNVVHFAEWLPGETLRFMYSTVTPQRSSPGWKANNDLWLQIVSDSGMLLTKETVVEAEESSGDYSWWGTEYHVYDDGRSLVYANPIEVGSIDRLTGEKTALLRIQPFEKARSDWAWIPGVGIIPGSTGFYFSYHGDISGTSEAYNPADFNIGRLDLTQGALLPVKKETGPFSQPSVSPEFEDGKQYVAYLQALNPIQSESSRYRIMMMDANGENNRVVFPLEEGSSLAPQKLVWSKSVSTRETWIAFIYQGNIWLVNPFTGIYNQITIDESVSRLIWE